MRFKYVVGVPTLSSGFSLFKRKISRKLILKFLKALYILVTLSMFQPSGCYAAVRVVDYCAGGNWFVFATPFLFFSSNFLICFVAFPSFFHYSSVVRSVFAEWALEQLATDSIFIKKSSSAMGPIYG